MTKYLAKMTLTTQAWAGLVGKPQNRFDAVKPAFEAAGYKLLEYWFAVDQGAVYLLIEGPDDPVSQLALQMASLGAGNPMHIEGSRLLTAAEAVEAMKKAQKMGFGAIPGAAAPAKR